MKIRNALVLSLLVLLAGCASVQPKYSQPSAQDKPEIAVRVFNIQHAEGEHAEKANFGELFAKYLAGHLQALKYSAVVVAKDTDIKSYRYLIVGNIAQIEAGSAATRFWVGMGAGAARMTITYKLLRVADNQALKTDTQSASDLISMDEQTCFARIQDQLAQQFAEGIAEQLATVE